MITGFDPLNDERAASAADRFAEARDAGATIGRIQIDWADLETAPGQYDADALEDAFEAPELEGMNLVVLLSTLDSDGLTIPDYLVEDGALREGLTLDAPEVRDAFLAFLDWFAERLKARNVWLISIGNEIIGPIQDGLATDAQAAALYSAAMDQWNTQAPEIGITLTFTIAAPDGIPIVFDAVRSRADMVAFNYYCLNADITVAGQSEWEARLAAMKEDAGSKEIFMQELGCPVGYGPQGRASSTGGTLDNQVRFFEYFGEQFATDPQLRAATLFQLYDWSPELAASFSKPLSDAGQPVLADRLEEWLATVGLVRWSDRTNRPAWETWLSAVRQVRDARAQIE